MTMIAASTAWMRPTMSLCSICKQFTPKAHMDWASRLKAALWEKALAASGKDQTLSKELELEFRACTPPPSGLLLSGSILEPDPLSAPKKSFVAHSASEPLPHKKNIYIKIDA